MNAGQMDSGQMDSGHMDAGQEDAARCDALGTFMTAATRNPPSDSVIFKIMGCEEWQDARRTGTYRGAAVDHSDGFIHFSTGDQVAETAARHFENRDDLVIVAVDPAALGPALRWEPSRGGALFPHLYATLPMSAILWVRPMPLGPDGVHQLPALDREPS